MFKEIIENIIKEEHPDLPNVTLKKEVAYRLPGSSSVENIGKK